MEIVKSVFQSKSKRYQFIRYCTVGETLMRPLVFYKKALELQKKYADRP